MLCRLICSDAASDHVVVSLGGPSWYSSVLEDKGIRVHHLGIHSTWSAVRSLFRLKNIIRESGADVVQCWSYRANVFGGFAAKAAGKPVVWGVHCSSISALRPASQTLVQISRLFARSNPDLIVHCSDSAAELHVKLGYPSAKSRVVHNGYDPETFFPNEESRSVTRKSLGLNVEDFVVGSVTRWDRLKDIPNLLAAIRIVLDEGVPLRCFLIGNGLTLENPGLAEELDRCGCRNSVVALGQRSDLPAIARALDLHVLASLTESLPNAVAETMLSGTPNVATDVGDTALLVGDAGWLVPPRNPRILAEAIIEGFREWSDRPSEWASRREACRQRVAERFSSSRMAAKYQDAWREAHERPQAL